MMSALRFYTHVKWDYQPTMKGPFTTYDEAVAYGVEQIERVGAWSFTVEKRWVREGKEHA